MSETVYNKPGSSVYHGAQHCSGAFFPEMCAISESAAKNRGLRPCKQCATDEDGGRDD